MKIQNVTAVYGLAICIWNRLQIIIPSKYNETYQTLLVFIGRFEHKMALPSSFERPYPHPHQPNI
jgi:hypothetical protein